MIIVRTTGDTEIAVCICIHVQRAHRWREGEKERGREGGREGGRERGREREGGRERGREGGREGGGERERERESSLRNQDMTIALSSNLSDTFFELPNQASMLSTCIASKLCTC